VSHCTKRKEADWICHILCGKCVLKYVIEGKMEVARRSGRGKKLLDKLKETRGYCKIKEKALDPIMWGIRFGRRYVPVVGQNLERMM
jgi:hypothetical protein